MIKKLLLYVFLLIMAVSLVLGFSGILGFIEPYSIYGRVATHLFKPVVMFGNNLLAAFFEWTGDYYFRRFEISILSMFSFFVAAISFVIVAIFSFARGRKFCNLICPVGALLGLASKLSLYKIQIDKKKCNSCGLCEQNCKSECINSKEKIIDTGNCVSCFNCISKCNRDGISYGRRK